MIENTERNLDKSQFRVGDWICHTVYKKPLLIVEDLGEGDFRTEPKSIITAKELKEGIFRHWTIQDAKDGDVICSGQIILLFKQWEDNADCNFVIAHAGIDISGKLQITNGHWLISNESKPATKEQRELLFLKMKEAGYTQN